MAPCSYCRRRSRLNLWGYRRMACILAKQSRIATSVMPLMHKQHGTALLASCPLAVNKASTTSANSTIKCSTNTQNTARAA